jgi:hypothetical protein
MIRVSIDSDDDEFVMRERRDLRDHDRDHRALAPLTGIA